MTPTPLEADGATVLAAADLSGLARSGSCIHSMDGIVQSAFAGLLLARYASDSGCYLFYCDERWEVQNDTLHRDVDGAKAFAEREFPGVSERWRHLK